MRRVGLGVVGITACGSDEVDPAVESVPGSVLDTMAPLDTTVGDTTPVSEAPMETVVETTTAP